MTIGRLAGAEWFQYVTEFPATFNPPVRYVVPDGNGSMMIRGPLQSNDQKVALVNGATVVAEISRISSVSGVAGVTVFR